MKIATDLGVWFGVGLFAAALTIVIGGCDIDKSVRLPVRPETAKAVGDEPGTEYSLADEPALRLRLNQAARAFERKQEVERLEKQNELLAANEDIDLATEGALIERSAKLGVIATVGEMADSALERIPGGDTVTALTGGGVAALFSSLFYSRRTRKEKEDSFNAGLKKAAQLTKTENA